MSSRNYRIRKIYVRLNPFLSVRARSQRVQWIMRDDSLISNGVPFFFEPWVAPDDFFTRDVGSYKPDRLEVLRRFLSEFIKWVKTRLTGEFISADGTRWRWNRSAQIYERGLDTSSIDE